MHAYIKKCGGAHYWIAKLMKNATIQIYLQIYLQLSLKSALTTQYVLILQVFM